MKKTPEIKLRLVEGEREWIEKQADEQERSMNWIVRTSSTISFQENLLECFGRKKSQNP